jgi:hypothetical protein
MGVGVESAPTTPGLHKGRADDGAEAAAVRAADTPQTKLCIVLAAGHAARNRHIRALQLDDVDILIVSRESALRHGPGVEGLLDQLDAGRAGAAEIISSTVCAPVC